MQFFFILIFTSISSILFSQVSQEWTARYNSYSDEAVSIAKDNQGNIFVTGSSTGTDSGLDYLTIKYNSSGDQLWLVRYNGTGNSNDIPVKIVVDTSGNSYVTGSSRGIGTGYDIATVKYDSSGVQLWSERYNSKFNEYDGANSLALDQYSNVFVTGFYSETPFSRRQITFKYNSSGKLIWTDSLYFPSEGIDIKVDQDGNSYITGVAKVGSFGSYASILTIKYDSLGRFMWINYYIGIAHQIDIPFALALDSYNNVFVTGRSIGNDSENDIVTIKYGSDGSEQWVNRYSRNPNSSDVATCMTIDNSDNIIVAGNSEGNFITIKYSNPGIEQWVAIYDGPSNNTEGVNSIVSDEFGNVYVTGSSVGTGVTFDYVTIKYNPIGLEKWLIRNSGKGDNADLPNDMLIDNLGNIYVTGFSFNEFSNIDYLTVKYSQTVGINSQLNLNSISFSLSQNYPNPFNPKTIINYELGITNYVSVKVFDALGKVVATLVNEKQNAGTYSIDFNGEGLPSGVYFYKLVVSPSNSLEAGSFVETKRMVLLK